MTALLGALVLLGWVLWPRPVAWQAFPGDVPERVSPAPSTPRGSGEGPLAVAEAMDLLALALGTGIAVVAAVEAVADRAGPLVATHLRHVAAALKWGVEPTLAWDGLPQVWAPAAQAMSLATVAGVPPTGLLRRAAAEVRQAESRRLEEEAARLSVRIVIPLGLCFLPAFGLLTVVPVVAALASGLLTGTT